MSYLDAATLDVLWHDEDAREVRLRDIITDRLGEKPPPAMDDFVVATYFFSFRTMTLEEAVGSGALAFFADKYGDSVNIYSVPGFSREVCGGPHVETTGEIGRFAIVKEQSSGRGVRRIRAVLEER